MPRTLARVHEVDKAFHTVRAVDRVSFEVMTGEIFALLGPNGAGKSTLIRMMLGMLPPDQGTIQWFDDHERSIGLDFRQIGYLPEDRGLYRDQTVGHTLEYFGQLRGMSSHQSKQAAQEWAVRLEVDRYLNDRLETLSKGNQQKVQVASALLHRPRLALLDEPFSGLDPLNQEMMMNVIRHLREQGTTVVLSAHQLELVERLADRVFLLANGRRVLSGTVPEVKSSVYGGHLLQIRFAASLDAQRFEPTQSIPNSIGFDRPDESTIRLTFQRQEQSAEWIKLALQVGEVAEFRGGALSLHEIYLRALSANNGSNLKKDGQRC